MALTANALPSIPGNFALPIDASMQFASAQTLTYTAYANNVNSVAVDLGLGRFDSMLALNITALDVSSGDETYVLHLLGSNDIAFGNGNVESLAVHDFGKSAHRIINTILGDNPTIPPTGLVGSILALPFTTLMQGVIYRYAKCYAVLAGTTPSITLSAWIVPAALT
jgi:lysophospholipase L1-like esterase